MKNKPLNLIVKSVSFLSIKANLRHLPKFGGGKYDGGVLGKVGMGELSGKVPG